MKSILLCGCALVALSACAHREPVTEKVVVERERQVPSRQTTVEHRLEPQADGTVTDERIVRERVVPRTEVQRTVTTTTHE